MRSLIKPDLQHVHALTRLADTRDSATVEERRVLEGVPYAENDVYLHRDTALMPRNRKVISAHIRQSRPI